MTLAYSQDEDKMFCELWMEIGRYAIKGAKEKGHQFWKRCYDYLHEHWKFLPIHFGVNRMNYHFKRGGVSFNRNVASLLAPTSMCCPACEWHWGQGHCASRFGNLQDRTWGQTIYHDPLLERAQRWWRELMASFK